MGCPILWVAFGLGCLALFVAYDARRPENHNHWRKYEIEGDNATGIVVTLDDVSSTSATNVNSTVALLRERLSPKLLDCSTSSCRPHQFLHLHHMKTGGTSIDGLLDCAMRRNTNHIAFKNLHECSVSQYANCLNGNNSQCLKQVKDAAVMSYCAPLKDLQAFAWTDTTTDANELPLHSLTVFRHPLDRVWSMFRFTTKRCYGCRELKDVYAEIDNGTSTLTGLCRVQLLNHQTFNVLDSPTEMTPDDQLAEAIHNMRYFFTMIGLTEELVATAEMAGVVFPWLATTVGNKTCPLPHANASPRNNFCGPNNGHWDLPNRPDDETARIILQHNRLDLQLYEAAVEQFRLQKLALNM